jgi:hypothetical protein
MSTSKTRQKQISTMANPVTIVLACLVVIVPLSLYIIFLGLSAIPYFQRK